MGYSEGQIDALCALNRGFYRTHADSFSATRQAAWPGWERVARVVEQNGGPGGAGAPQPLRVLDVACGNLRLKRFLAGCFPGQAPSYVGIDDCAPLAQGEGLGDGAVLLEQDVVGMLRQEGAKALASSWRQAVGAAFGQGDAGIGLVACFGFLHHVPTARLRLALLEALLSAARPGGIVAVSLWRFADDALMRAKAERASKAGTMRLGWKDGALEAGDYLLGWQGDVGALRFCHSFNDDEVDALAAAATSRASLLDRFRADGRTRALNEYLVFQAL